MADNDKGEETKGTDNPEGTGEKGTDGQPEGKEEQKVEPAPISATDALRTPEGQQILGQQLDTLLGQRDAYRQQDEDERGLLERPDDEVGRQTKEQVARARQMREVYPHARRDFYENTIAPALQSIPELQELTPEEEQVLLSPSLRTEADVMKAIVDVVANRRLTKEMPTKIEEAIAAKAQAKTDEEIAKGNETQVPGLGGGTPARATSETTDPDKLLAEHFNENPLPE